MSRKLFLHLGCFLSVVVTAPAFAAPSSSIGLQSYKTHSRLVVKVDSGMETSWKSTAHGFELFLKGAMLSDLGAVLGSEAAFVREISAQIEAQRDPRLSALTLQETANGVLVAGKWRFPKGDQAPADPTMEHFDYREKNPPEYVIDFWPKKGPTLGEVRTQAARAKRQAEIDRLEQDARARRDRRIANLQNRADAEDVQKFCRAPLNEQTEIFLSLAPVHEKPDFSQWFKVTSPDSEYNYFEPKGDEKDAQYVRVALDLYKQTKYGLVIRALDFFDAEHPKSIFKQEMRFLRANAYLKLSMEELAMPLLKDLTLTSGDTPAGLYSGIFITMKAMERQQYLAALEGFLWLINRYPAHRMSWLFHLGAAENLFNLRQTERAAKEYEWVVENAPEKRFQAEAAFRIGDLYLSRLQYEQALATYYQGLSRFKEEAKRFPAISINRAESLYWLGQYDRAEAAFQEFLKEHSGHPAGWRATFRLAEIHGRREGEKAKADSKQWFLETINRFPYSPGATLARLRLLPCGDHAGFNYDAAERFYSGEATKFDGDGEVLMNRFKDFRALSHVRTLLTMGKEEEAVATAIRELQTNAKSEARHIMGDTLRAIFRKTVMSMLDGGKKFEALNFYEKNAPAIPRAYSGTEASVEQDYLLKLSQAAADLGLGESAKKLNESYRVSQAEAAHGRTPSSSGPLPDDIETKLRRSEQEFAEAKALWIGAGGAPDAETQAKIREKLGKVEEESDHSFEKETLLGVLDEKAGKDASALSHALKSQLLAVSQDPVDKARLDYWVAGLQARAGDLRDALQTYRKLQRLKQSDGQVDGAKEDQEVSKREKSAHLIKPNPAANVPVLSALGVPTLPATDELILAEGEILAKLGKWGEAAEAYSRAVEKGLGGNHALYEYSRALSRSPSSTDRAQAQEQMEKLASSKIDDFWRRLARQAVNPESSRNETKTNAKEGGK